MIKILTLKSSLSEINFGKQPLFPFLIPTLLLKLIAGLSSAYLFKTYYGGGDTFYIFEKAIFLKTVLLENGFEAFWVFPRRINLPESAFYLYGDFPDLTPRFVFFCKLTALVSLITMGNFWLTNLCFSLFAFIGLYYCANTLAKQFPDGKYAFAFGFLGLPSVVFWSSGLNKESILLGSLSMAVAIFFKLLNYKTLTIKSLIGYLAVFIFFIWLIFKIKYYVLGALLPVLFAYFVVYRLFYTNKKTIPKTIFLQTVVFMAFFGLCLFLATFLHPHLRLEVILTTIEDNFLQASEASDADSLIFYREMYPTLESILKNVPIALFAAFFEPLVWENSQFLRLVAGVENLILYAFFLLTSFYIRIKHENILILVAALLYIFFLGTLLALTTPNVGTLVRHKIAFMPFLASLLAYPFAFIKFKQLV